MTRMVAASAVLLALVIPALAQDSLNCRQVGLWPPGGIADNGGWGIALDPVRNLGFLAMEADESLGRDLYYGVRILDVSDPTQPRKLSRFYPGHDDNATGLEYQANRLYLGYEGEPLQVWDVSDPEQPQHLGTQQASYGGYRLTLAGEYAYLAALCAGLRIVDVSDPRNPVEIGHCATGHINDIAVTGELAYVVGDSVLHVVDLNDPTNPYRVGYWTAPVQRWLEGVAVAGDYAYLTQELRSDSGYLYVVDVSNPEEPVLVGSRRTGREPRQITVSDDLAYVATYPGLFIYDVTNPADPVEVGYYLAPSPWAPVVAGELVYVADLLAGLRVIEFLGAGVEEPPDTRPRFTGRSPTVVRGVLNLGAGHDRNPPGDFGSCPKPALLDISGRKVMELVPGENDVRHLAPGVYFVRRQDTGESGRLVLVE
ncbi:MAG: hypothetical protein R6X14_08300 [bacterium]